MPKKVKVVKLVGKVIVISYFDYHGMVYHEVLPHTTVTVWKILVENIQWKCPELYPPWHLCDDNVRPHVIKFIAQYLGWQISNVYHGLDTVQTLLHMSFLFPCLKSELQCLLGWMFWRQCQKTDSDTSSWTGRHNGPNAYIKLNGGEFKKDCIKSDSA